MTTSTRRCARSHTFTYTGAEGRRRACTPPASQLLSLVLCVPLCPSSHFLTPCQQKVVIPKMPREEWACQLPHCYVIADPNRRVVLYSATSVPPGIVPVSLTWLAPLISVPTLSCVRRPLPYWGANPRFKELNQSPSISQRDQIHAPLLFLLGRA